MEFISEKIENNEKITLVKIEGKVSSASVMELKKNITNLIKNENIFLLMDLTELTFINSMGLGTIVNALKKLEK